MDMHQPRLALIDLDAPLLQEPHKVHHAAEVFPWLKAQGLIQWTRYRGRSQTYH
jgi:hypothetical protein